MRKNFLSMAPHLSLILNLGGMDKSPKVWVLNWNYCFLQWNPYPLGTLSHLHANSFLLQVSVIEAFSVVILTFQRALLNPGWKGAVLMTQPPHASKHNCEVYSPQHLTSSNALSLWFPGNPIIKITHWSCHLHVSVPYSFPWEHFLSKPCVPSPSLVPH